MKNAQDASSIQTILAIVFLLLIFGLVGRWDYEDALVDDLVDDHVAAQAPVRTLMCEENAESMSAESRHLKPVAATVTHQGLTEKAQASFVSNCIVTD